MASGAMAGVVASKVRHKRQGREVQETDQERVKRQQKQLRDLLESLTSKESQKVMIMLTYFAKHVKYSRCLM